MIIKFSKVDCSGNEQKYIHNVIQSGWLTTAKKCTEFESKFAKFINAKYACAVNSCTSALHLALEAIGISSDDKVVVPSYTFTATAEVIRYFNADPLFLDVKEETSLLDLELLEKALINNRKIKAVILVHFGGRTFTASQYSKLKKLKNRHNVKIIHDAAHAFPTKHNGKYIGTFDDITCFSFYANKCITTGEGGMITTNNFELYERIKLMRLHGIDRDVWDRFTSGSAKWEYDVKAAGYKYNLPDLNAAIGIAQLERAEKMRVERHKIAYKYYNEIKNINLLSCSLYRGSDINNHSWHLFQIYLKKNKNINRNQLIQELNSFGIGTSVHYKPLHRMSYYKKKYKLKNEMFPNSEKLWNSVVSLPIYSLLKPNEQNYIISKLRVILNKY